MNGEIFWSGNSITLTNVISEFYGGELSGDLFAKFNNKQSSEIDFNFDESMHSAIAARVPSHLPLCVDTAADV